MQKIIDFTDQLLAHMGVTDIQVHVEETDSFYEVNLATDEQQSGMLIGYHGETIASLQKVLSLVFREKLESDKKIVVNINDYKQKREAAVSTMADRLAERVLETGQPQVLPSLPANERLIVHMMFKDHPELQTQSEGEGNQRRLVISLK